MLTVGQLGKRLGLSRSTLLYYDRLGLLCPSARSGTGYRLYTEEDAGRLEMIVLFRGLGLPLGEIAGLLDSVPGSMGRALEQRLLGINDEIATLRRQQELILELLQNAEAGRQARAMNKAGWVGVLLAAGLDDAAMDRWHAEFERLAPQAHQDFLESLGIAGDEIRLIRSRARTSVEAADGLGNSA